MPRLVPSPNSRDLHETRAEVRQRKAPKTQGSPSGDRAAYETFIAKILANPVLVSGSTKRWKYKWEEVEIKDDASCSTYTGTNVGRRKSGTDEITFALNTCEFCQESGAATKVGPGILISNIPAGFELKAVAENTCVIMHAMRRRNGKPLYVFSMASPIDGSCSNLI